MVDLENLTQETGERVLIRECDVAAAAWAEAERERERQAWVRESFYYKKRLCPRAKRVH